MGSEAQTLNLRTAPIMTKTNSLATPVDPHYIEQAVREGVANNLSDLNPTPTHIGKTRSESTSTLFCKATCGSYDSQTQARDKLAANYKTANNDAHGFLVQGQLMLPVSNRLH